jgi:Rieske Fe-S protein
MTDSPHLDRRQFVNVVLTALGTIMGAVIGLPAIGYLISPALRVQKKEAWIPLGPLENYPLGKPTLFTFNRATVNGWEKTVNSYGVFVLRKSESEVLVLSNICTHLSCRVNWDEAAGAYVCPCHDARFAINGDVLSGPPPRPLDGYSGEKVKIEEGIVSIHFEEG